MSERKARRRTSARSKVTERTFYPALMEVIRDAGGSSVQEISYNSEPDIVFRLNSHDWLLSVKIGESTGVVKSAFVQYLRHKEESRIPFGILVTLPDTVRRIEPTESSIRNAVLTTPISTLIDAGDVKDEFRNLTFPSLITLLQQEILIRLRQRQLTYYPLRRVISLLQRQVQETMEEVSLKEAEMLRIITDPDLLMDLGSLKEDQVQDVAHFLASYILLSQILFLRLFTAAQPDFLTRPITPVTHARLRDAFNMVLDVNYRPIYKVNVLDVIPEIYLKDTFTLIWGLEVERARYELPGRIFHQLMPSNIRKMLAAFYTRPLAADLLANLTIKNESSTVLDPACGSGTILVSAYRRKLNLFKEQQKAGQPHRRFCESEIFGADIFPFAVHLTSANLAAMDPGTTISRTQVIQKDSLRLSPGKVYESGIQVELFPERPTAKTTEGEEYEVPLDTVDTVLMNPPFTKVERGIREFVDMDRFYERIGGEVGLWGHFTALADVFLKDTGVFGAVIPINVLRGRESERVRRILFEEWSPLYIVKPTYNYGFSEWAEYRDVLFVARKDKPSPDHQVKFCLVKKDLTRLTDDDVAMIADKVKTQAQLRNNDLIDIDSHKLSDVKKRFNNLMWFCGVTDLEHRDLIIDFFNSFSPKLSRFPSDQRYSRTGYRCSSGVSKFLFLTRHLEDSRIEQAFLRFSKQSPSSITAQSPLGASYKIATQALLPSLRTPVGVSKMNLTDVCDYVAHQPYRELERVCRAANVESPMEDFWRYLPKSLDNIEAYLAISRRINPFSPSHYLVSFFSEKPIYPSDQMNVILEDDIKRASSLCAILNSILFFTQFILLKEESTGRYIDIRLHDLNEMHLIPPVSSIEALTNVFEHYSKINFPALRKQFDQNFDERYEEFWEREREAVERRLWSVLGKPVKPLLSRLNFDLAVCQALGIRVTKDELIKLYEVLVYEMILIKGLRRD